jgi:hypothetical protein
VGLKLNGTHQLLMPMNLLGDNIETSNENAETFIYTSKDVSLKVNLEKTKYTLVSHHQIAGQNWDIKIANRLFKNVSPFRYL